MRTINTSTTIHFRRIWHYFVSQYLYLAHLITGRRLELKFISESKSIVFAKSYFTIYLEVRGCYQVKINDRIVLPGNISMIRLDPAQVRGTLTLLFLGCRQTIIKTYTLSPIHLHTKKLSNALPEEPILRIRDPQLNSKIVLSKKLQGIPLSTLDLSTLKIGSELNKLRVCTSLKQIELEPYQLSQ